MDMLNANMLLQQTAELERKLAGKNRELEIEAALERVRTSAMAMQKSDELVALIDTVQKELTKLEFLLNNCIFWIIRKSHTEQHGG